MNEEDRAYLDQTVVEVTLRLTLNEDWTQTVAWGDLLDLEAGESVVYVKREVIE